MTPSLPTEEKMLHGGVMDFIWIHMHLGFLLKTTPCQSQVLDYVICFPQDDLLLSSSSGNDVFKFLLFCRVTSVMQT